MKNKGAERILKKLEGIFIATITPFTKELEIDFDLIETHINFLREKNIQGIVVCGTNGESPSLTVAEKKQVIKKSVNTAKELPVLAGAYSCSLKESIEIIQFAEDCGAAAGVITTPFFFRRPPPVGIYDFFSKILEQTKDFPIIICNVPIYSLIEIEPKIIKQLKNKFPNVLGIKDLSGKPESITNYLRAFPELSILVGSDRLVFHGLNIGCAGIVSAIGNVLPDHVVDIYHKFQEGHRDQAWIAQESLTGIRALFKRFPSRAALKFILSKISGQESYVRPPLQDLTADEKETLLQILTEHGLFLPSAAPQ
ncbi:MAG: hypothetical protein GF308_12085 [Candidatus Heimdallarchaeota archaeon]|nr:hypothetical protein [Candidatus Heimdallarchaeota archaeon]